MSFGAIWDPFTQFLRDVLTSLADAFSFVGAHRWALAIIALTLIVRTLLLPLAIKQIKSMRETQRLQPEVARLRQKYRNDRQKQMQEMQALYQREGVNPYASCLPMLPQMPILIGMYSVIRRLDPPEGMPFLGLGDLSGPSSKSVAGWALIILMTAAQLLSTRQLNPGQTDQQRRMQMLMPLMFVIFFINLPAALVLYYTTQTLYQLVQQLVMTRDMRKPGSGWRGLLGLKPAGGAGNKPGAKKGPREEKPQVRPPAPKPQERPASQPFDPLAARRTLDEKRDARRRRRKKKKQRKR